jgi:hypothetical protein
MQIILDVIEWYPFIKMMIQCDLLDYSKEDDFNENVLTTSARFMTEIVYDTF